MIKVKKHINESSGTAYDSLNPLVDKILTTAYNTIEKEGNINVSFNVPASQLSHYSERLGEVLPNGLTVNIVENQGGTTNADVDIAKGDMRLFLSPALAPIESNRVYREGNFDILGQIKKVYSKDVLHELTHCLNGATNNGYQNITPDAMKSDVYEEASGLLYLFSKTEMNARVSQTYAMLVRQIDDNQGLTKLDFVNASKRFVYGQDVNTRFTLNTSIYGMMRSIAKLEGENYNNYLVSTKTATANDLVSYLITFGENELNVKKFQPEVKKEFRDSDGDCIGLFKESKVIHDEQSFNEVRDNLVGQLKDILVNYQSRLNKLIVRAYRYHLGKENEHGNENN